MGPKSRFADGEKVLCFHGPLLYEAKCLQSQIRDKHMKYFIHYSGWNKNWDEWVPESRVLKYNEANLQKQKEITQTHASNKKSKSQKTLPKKDKEVEKEIPAEKSSPAEKPKPSPTEKPKPTPVEKPPKPKPEKRSIPSPVPEIIILSDSPPSEPKKKIKIRPFMEEFEPEKPIKIEVPQMLKNWLVDDSDLITRQKKILHLPARVTVDHIIAGFVKDKVSVKGLTQYQENGIVQFAKEIRSCFNVALGKLLLYKFERPQYGEMLAEYPETSMCQIYGAIHMLRLIAQLGDLLRILQIKGNRLACLLEQVDDFKRYITQNPSFFNLNDYEVASPEYRRRAL